MNNRWNRFLSLLLALCTVLTMIPAGFALEAEEPLPEQAQAVEEGTVPAEESAEEPAEEPVQAVAEEPAEEAEAAESVAAEDTGVMAAATVIPDQTSDKDYPTLTVSGYSRGSAAEELQDLLNQERVGNAASALTRSEAAMQAALAMAAESVCGSDAKRPNGESWLTLAGDAKLEVNEGTAPLYAFTVTDSTDAEEALDNLAAECPEILNSAAYNNIGIGCFELDDGCTYWAILLLSGTAYKDAGSLGNERYSCAVPFTSEDVSVSLAVELDKTALDQGESVTMDVKLTNGLDEIAVSNADLVFASSNTKVITVSDAGVITAVGSGSAAVTVSLAADKSISVSKDLTSTLNLTAPKLTKIANATAGITVTWQKVPGATGYWVYRRLANGKWSTNGRLYIAGANETSYTDKTAAAGTTYYYTVLSVYTANNTTTQGAKDETGIGICRLPTPTHKSAKASSDGITFQWNGVTGAAGYTIWRRSGSSGWTKIGTVGSSVTSFVDTNVTKGTKYIYTVRAYNGASQSAYIYSGKSATATATVATTEYTVRSNVYYRTGAGTNNKAVGTLKAGTRVNIISGWSKKVNGNTWYKVLLNGNVYYVMSDYLLAIPTLKSVGNSSAGILLTWGKVANATGYTVWRKENNSGWKKVATISSGSTTSYTDPDAKLTVGNRYTYTVRATYGSVASWYNTAGRYIDYVKTPALVSASGSTSTGKITFTWKAVDGVDGYRVYRKVDGGSWKLIKTIEDPTAASYVDADVVNMSQYTYTVRAYIGSTLSYYVTSGMSEILIPSDTLTTVAVKADTKYYTGPGTNYTASGTLKAGAQVKVVSSEMNSGWCRVLITNTYGKHWRYIASSSLLTNPKLNKAEVTSTGIRVYWNKVSSATGYEVWRRVGTGGWKRIAILSSGSTVNYLDPSVSSGTKYTYTVRATVGSVRSWYETPGISTVFMSVPSLTGISSSKTGITFSWGLVDGANGYYIYRRPIVNGVRGSWTRIAVISNGSTLSYKDTKNLVKGTTYEYTARAYYSTSIYSGYQSPGLTASAQETLNPNTVKYKLTAAAKYYTLVNGGVYASGYKEGQNLKKGDTINVVEGITVTTQGIEYTAFLKDGKYYYVASSVIEKA